MRHLINLLNEAEAPEPQSILIVVHPGSACGSTDFNLGKYDGRSAREHLAQDIASWEEGILVIDGEYSDELPDYPQLDMAIKNTLNAAHAAGKLSMRIFACDNCTDGWEAKVGELLTHIPREFRLEITGAWFFANDLAGCVNAVYAQAAPLGFDRIDVRDSVIRDPDGHDDYEDDDEDDDEDMKNIWG